MAYVVARPKGRFEIRESVHTAKGPRARTLANFSELTDDVLVRAAGRATRPFDPASVRASAAARTAHGPHPGPAHTRPEMQHFVEAARRMVTSLEPRPTVARQDPGDALIDLLGFVAQIRSFGPERPREALGFPPLAQVRARRLTAGPD